jgi:hypothetical protein
MRKEVTQPKPAYQKPGIEALGTFAQLTQGSKWQSLSDLSHGIGEAIASGGIGS